MILWGISTCFITELLRTVLDNPISGWTPDDGDKDQIASAISELLVERARMLEEYFSIEISRTGCIAAIPIIIKSYVPPMGALPLFLFHLSTRVEFSAEQQCFQSIARELAEFYAIRPPTNLKLMEVSRNSTSASEPASTPTQSSPDTPKDFE